MKKIVIIFLLLTGSFIKINAQGCSDAGFCSLKYHSQDTKEELRNIVSVGNVIGVGDGNTFINGSYISYNRKFGSSVYWDTKFTANLASGNLATNFNAGDVFTTITFDASANKYKKGSLKILGGIKIPLTSANDKAGGKPLPLTYQASVGTFDALFGFNFTKNNWEFTNAYQIPITKRNKNTFFKEYSVSKEFPTTNKFEREADVLLRAAYNLRKITKTISLKPNILAIYHTGTDTYEDIFGKRQLLNGSKGITLNANIIGSFEVNKKSILEVSLAAPFVVRDVRPDGLTRKFTASIEYRFSF